VTKVHCSLPFLYPFYNIASLIGMITMHLGVPSRVCFCHPPFSIGHTSELSGSYPPIIILLRTLHTTLHPCATPHLCQCVLHHQVCVKLVMAAEAPEGTSPKYQPELPKYDDLPDAVSKVGSECLGSLYLWCQTCSCVLISSPLLCSASKPAT
jgi:hypothetical protein